MGKIYDALQRAEEERALLGGAPAGRAPELVSEARAPGRRATQARQQERQEARRARVMVSGLATNVTEEFRSLRQRIQSLRRDREIKSLVVTSALPGEGKTTTAMNLALSFGLEPESRTCLIDADLRAPAVHRALPDQPDAGLAELLEVDAKLEEALVEIEGTRLSVLPVRAIPSQPSELLSSRRMRELLQDLSANFDTIIIDAPPIAGLPDAGALIDLCDAALFVVVAGQTNRQDAAAALDRVARHKFIGTVLNRFDSPRTPYGETYYKRRS